MKSKYLNTFLLTIIVIFSIIRVVNLDADFPKIVKRTAVIYSDEGWWTNGAVNKIIRDKWIVEGDYNPVIKLPVGYLIQYINLSIFGLGLEVARAAVVIFSLFIFFLIYLIAKRYMDQSSSLILILVLSLNPLLFAFSRTATLEIFMIFFIVLSIFLSLQNKGNEKLWAVLTGICIFLAALTKTTAIFAIPLLIYLIWQKGKFTKESIKLISSFLLAFTFLYFSYNFMVSRFFPEDYQLFQQINLQDKALSNPLKILPYFLYSLAEMKHIGAEYFYPVIMIISALFFISKRYRKNKLVSISGLWLFFNLAILGMVSEHPPRYYVSITIPLIILFMLAIYEIGKSLNKTNKMILQIIIIAYFIFIPGSRIIYSTLVSPSYSFVEMCRGIKNRISEQNKDLDDITIIGPFVNTISLETGLKSINTRRGTMDRHYLQLINDDKKIPDSISIHADIKWKLKKYDPDYLIGRADSKVEEIIQKRYKMETVDAWAVYPESRFSRIITLEKLIER